MTVNNTQLPTSSTVGDAVAVEDTGTTNGAGAKILVPLSAPAIIVQSQNVVLEQGTGVTPAAALQVKTGAGNLFSLYVINRNAAIRYLFIVDNTSGAITPLKGCPIGIPPGSELTLGTDFFGLPGWSFSTGIGLVISSSNTALGAVTAADHDMMASYI
jgi:hypothetical protein